MLAPNEPPISSALLAARRQLINRGKPLRRWEVGNFRFSAQLHDRALWIIIEAQSCESFAFRALNLSADTLDVHHIEVEDGALNLEGTSEVGAWKVAMSTKLRDATTLLHSRATFIPSRDLLVAAVPRDLYVLDSPTSEGTATGRLITTQRGFQTGSLFAVTATSSVFYLQNFSSLTKYFEDTKTTPKDSVGGTWPEIGFSLPVSQSHALLTSNEYTLSDVALIFEDTAPGSDGEVASRYLEALANVVRNLEAPPRSYHNWPRRAYQTVYDLSQSPECTNTVNGRRYLAPYVNTTNKPPESMVQLTVIVALLELEAWAGSTFTLTRELLDGLATFFNEDVGSIVRWLPGERFAEREDEHQTHEAMDSWYLYHVLFNLCRLATAGNKDAKRMLERSLPYAMRVAKRFAYRWPIFFNLTTLEIIQAEAEKGSGGENDVCGLYALVMLHAHDIFGTTTFLDEAEEALNSIQGFGFGLTYQTNVTGFAAEAALRFWKRTGEQRYYDLALIALANVFDNLAIWDCRYDNARYYSSYFGLFPLRGAPYIAAYEEVEALAKFHELLRLADGKLPWSVTLLSSEYAKWLLGRSWQYFPGELPAEVLAAKARNGNVRRELSVPLEDLQDGRVKSGQVGQEIYGAGLALVCTTRHFRKIPNASFVLFCEYPLFPEGKNRYRVAGDPIMSCLVRLIPVNPNALIDENAVSVLGSKRHRPCRSVEGHVTFEARGNDLLVVRAPAKRKRR